LAVRSQSASRKKSSPAVTLKIPSELYDKLSDLIDGTGFRSVTEFAVYLLRDVVAGGRIKSPTPGLSEREVDLVRQRLRALGYIE
jgi:hypothetical protein